MEAAPLTLAHAHARNAVLETKRANPVAASEEHDLAAAEFAAAAQTTNDTEAVRLLNLLEQHHKRLGQILKANHNASQNVSQVSPPHTKTGVLDAQPPRLVKTGRRDLSTNITSNLASARGIPSSRQKRSTPISPLVSNQHADGRFSEDKLKQELRPTTSSRPSWAPPADVANDHNPVDTTVSDTPFQQFYATFEGLMSKLSAPLAFAGLPLSSAQPAPKPIKQRATEALQSSVDYSQLISRAALRAVRNDQPGYNPAESFYVVPTTGGTTSYAEIMSRADREERTFRDHRRNSSNVSNDDFVDASSTILSPPLRATTSSSKKASEIKYNGKTMEEIALENQALKHLSDTLSKRLHVFEMSAQTSSAALAHSIRSLNLSPSGTPENSRGKIKSGISMAFSPDQILGQLNSQGQSADAQRLNLRIAELEDILKKSDSRARKKEEENAKLRDMLTKYRDKWDNLKAGAKARREKQGEPSKRGEKDGEGGEGKNEMMT